MCSILANNTVNLNITKKNKSHLSEFFSILCVFPLLFPDFSSLFKIQTFPWLENAFQFFQVFQSEWELCASDYFSVHF